jgi:hypothetical protein
MAELITKVVPGGDNRAKQGVRNQLMHMLRDKKFKGKEGARSVAIATVIG